MRALLAKFPDEAPRVERAWIGGVRALKEIVYELLNRDIAEKQAKTQAVHIGPR